MRPVVLFLAIVLGFITCKKDRLDIESFWQCNKSQNLDSLAISGKITGSWIWIKQACFATGNTLPANKNIKAIFNSNHTFTVNEGSAILTQGTWKLKPIDGTNWGLDLSSASEYLYGRILFCVDEVLFNDSYIDGCDHLFQKSN